MLAISCNTAIPLRDKKPRGSKASPDNSLTSLKWLQQLRAPDLYQEEKSITSPSPSVLSAQDYQESDKEMEKDESSVSLASLRRCITQATEFKRDPTRFKEDTAKPPFSYTTLIYLAIESNSKDKVMLGEIYQWIRDNFKYYRIAEFTWQNSVRHNLSLNEFFTKVARSERHTGKGSYWKINPDYQQILSSNELQQFNLLQATRVKGKSRKRSNSISNGASNHSTPSSFHKRSRSESTTQVPVADLCHLPGDLNWISLLSSQKVNSCGMCTDTHNCRPLFGSPVLGTPDLGHIGEPLNCSPAMIPMVLTNRLPETPPYIRPTSNSAATSLEDLTVQDSPSPLLPSWADSRSESPAILLEHPWAESRDSINQKLLSLGTKTRNTLLNNQWSPEYAAWNSTTHQVIGTTPKLTYRSSNKMTVV